MVFEIKYYLTSFSVLMKVMKLEILIFMWTNYYNVVSSITVTH